MATLWWNVAVLKTELETGPEFQSGTGLGVGLDTGLEVNLEDGREAGPMEGLTGGPGA